jgi:hypothetical protein
MTNTKESLTFSAMRKELPCEFGKEERGCGCGNCSMLEAWIEEVRE